MLAVSPVVLTLLGFVLALASALLAGGVSWGVFRTQLERQREELGDLRREVRELRTTVQDLTTKLAVVADRHGREHAT
jgi:hypothetical protein